MKNLINELLSTYEKYDEFKRQLQRYNDFVQSDDGRFVHDIFKTLKLAMTLELVSARFTKLPAAEKDVNQRVIYQLDQMLEFLMAPMRMVNEKHLKKAQIYKPPTLMGAGKPNPTKKGAKHGR